MKRIRKWLRFYFATSLNSHRPDLYKSNHALKCIQSSTIPRFTYTRQFHETGTVHEGDDDDKGVSRLERMGILFALYRHCVCTA